MTKGLYVDVWREGLKNEKQVRELLDFCRGAGITDLYAHVHKDRGSNIKYDYLKHLLRDAGDMRVHAWFSLQVGRLNVWTSTYYDVSLLMEIKGVAGITMLINPIIPKARALLTEKIQETIQSYPNLYGVHLDKMRYPQVNVGTGSEQDKKEGLLALLSEVRSVSGNRLVSLPVSLCNIGICPWEEWLSTGAIDEVHQMLFQQKDEAFERGLRSLPDDSKTVILACDFCGIALTKQRLLKLLDRGLSVSFYSYGSRTFASTREQFKDLIYGYR